MINNAFKSLEMYRKSLGASWMKNEAISSNLANANTPGYKRQDVAFEHVLSSELKKNISGSTTHEKHIPISRVSDEAKIVTEEHTSARKDDNNVNVDVEMAELAENQIRYNALITQLNSRIARVRNAIREGR